MTRFVGVRDMVRWVRATGPEAVIAGMIPYLESDFLRWPSFEKTPRVASHTPFGVIELMPTSDYELYAFKYVNGHPSNPANGFQTVTAFGTLASVSNGYPILVAEMTLLTALRTAATSAMVARHLARSDSGTLGMIGTGSQAEFQALGMRAALGIDRVQVWDTDSHAMDKFARNMRPLGFEVRVASSSADAAAGADVVTTCTADKALATVLSNESVERGMHINAIGGDCPGKTELDPAILERSRVFVEFTPQTRVEGEIQQMSDDFEVVEFWQVLSGEATGRMSREEITVFDSVGFAIEDFSALRYLADRVAGTDFEKEIDLVADPADPKDLFGMVDVPVPVP
jgi:ornithine cyclodeaminase